MTDTLMWQVHPPLVQPSSSQVWDMGIFVEDPVRCNAARIEHSCDQELSITCVPGCTSATEVRDRAETKRRNCVGLMRFQVVRKHYKNQGVILQEVGHEKTKLQMNGKSLPLSISWCRSHSVPIITGTSMGSMFSNQGTILNMEGVWVFHILTSLKWGDEIRASSTVQVLLALDCDSLSGAPSATLTGLES